MDIIKELADGFVVLIRAGAVMRFIYCMIRLSTNEEEATMYKKRARNVIVFYILAETIWQIKDVVSGYFI